VNGKVGSVNPVTAKELEVTFVKVIDIVTSLPPIGTGAKSAAAGENDAVGVSPCPLNVISDVAPVTFAVSVPGFAPKAVGVNVTGTEMVWPVDKVAGNGLLGVPIVYAEPDSVNEVTVVGEEAVKVAF
jgi:hypothetical protein